MSNPRSTQQGLSLVEIAIGLVVVGIIFAMGAPAFNNWLQSAQVRTAAESILNGLQLARSEAVRRNTNVRFNLTDATGAVAWSVDCVTVTADCPVGIQSRTAGEGGNNAGVGIDVTEIPSPTPAGYFNTPLAAGTALPAGVTFDSLGRVPTANVGADIARIDVTNTVAADARRMVIFIKSGGQTRMCDPAIAVSNNPQGCS